MAPEFKGERLGTIVLRRAIVPIARPVVGCIETALIRINIRRSRSRWRRNLRVNDWGQSFYVGRLSSIARLVVG